MLVLSNPIRCCWCARNSPTLAEERTLRVGALEIHAQRNLDVAEPDRLRPALPAHEKDELFADGRSARRDFVTRPDPDDLVFPFGTMSIAHNLNQRSPPRARI